MALITQDTYNSLLRSVYKELSVPGPPGHKSNFHNCSNTCHLNLQVADALAYLSVFEASWPKIAVSLVFNQHSGKVTLSVAANGVVPERSLTHLRKVWDELQEIHRTSKHVSMVSGAPPRRSPEALTREFLLGILDFSFLRFAKCVHYWGKPILSFFLPCIKDKMIKEKNNQALEMVKTLNNAYLSLLRLTAKPLPSKIPRQTLNETLRTLHGVNRDWEGHLNDFTEASSLVLKWEKLSDGIPFRQCLRTILAILHAGNKLLSISSSYPTMLDGSMQIIQVAPCMQSFCIPISPNDFQPLIPSWIKPETAKHISKELWYYLLQWGSKELLRETAQFKVEDKPCHAECNLLLHHIKQGIKGSPAKFVFGSSSPSCYACNNFFLAYNHAIDVSPRPGSCKLFMSRTQRKLDATWISPPLDLLDESLRSAIEKAAISKMQEDLLNYVIKRAEKWEKLMLIRKTRNIPGREWTPLWCLDT